MPDQRPTVKVQRQSEALEDKAPGGTTAQEKKAGRTGGKAFAS